jgi:chemotaxis response regulator CheB
MKVVIAEPNRTESLLLVSMLWAAGEVSVVRVASNGAGAIRPVLDEEPDVLILGARFDPKEGLGLLHAVRPLLPALRVIAVGDRPSNEFRRAFLLGDIDLLLAGPNRAHVISEVLRQWQREERYQPWASFIGAPGKRSRTA